jgi:hypothetical protein
MTEDELLPAALPTRACTTSWLLSLLLCGYGRLVARSAQHRRHFDEDLGLFPLRPVACGMMVVGAPVWCCAARWRVQGPRENRLASVLTPRLPLGATRPEYASHAAAHSPDTIEASWQQRPTLSHESESSLTRGSKAVAPPHTRPHLYTASSLLSREAASAGAPFLPEIYWWCRGFAGSEDGALALLFSPRDDAQHADSPRARAHTHTHTNTHTVRTQ